MPVDTPVTVSFAWEDLGCEHATARVRSAGIAVGCPCALDPYTEFVDAFDTLVTGLPNTGLLVAYRNGDPDPAWVHRAAWVEPRALRDQLGIVPGAWRRATVSLLPAGHRTDDGRPTGNPHVPTIRVTVDDRRTEVLVLLDAHAWLCDAWAAVDRDRRVEAADFDARRVAALPASSARMLWAFLDAGITTDELRAFGSLPPDDMVAAVAATGLLDAPETVQVTAARVAAAQPGASVRRVADATHATLL